MPTPTAFGSLDRDRILVVATDTGVAALLDVLLHPLMQSTLQLLPPSVVVVAEARLRTPIGYAGIARDPFPDFPCDVVKPAVAVSTTNTRFSLICRSDVISRRCRNVVVGGVALGS